MKVAKLDLAALTLDPENARVHGKENLAAIRASLEEFGQRFPIIVDADNVVRAGNGRVVAARELGWKTIYAVRATDLSPEQLRAFSIANNRTSELAGWDTEVLARTLAELRESNPELVEAAGFSKEEVVDLVELYGRRPELLRADVEPEGEEAEPLARLDQRSEPVEDPPRYPAQIGAVCPECGHEFEVSTLPEAIAAKAASSS